MFKRTRVSAAVAVVAGGLAMQAGLAYAQQQDQRVEVTGSRIKRTDAETASPVQVISKQEIEQSGKGTVAEYLQTLTADSQGSVPFTYGRGFSGATSAGISLRGLGANATLVLVNGRRVTSAVLADDAQRTYVDLNQIPLEAVERVEVVKDGASALYGSDAVAGVVNIILRKNYVGTTVKATYGVSEEGDGNEPRIAITHGFGDLARDGFNVLLNVEAGKKDPIYYRDRQGRGPVGVSAIGQAPWGFNPNIGPTNNIPRAGGNGTIPVGANGLPVANSAAPSFIGNVLGPDGIYHSRGATFPAAQAYCLANTNLPQNDVGGGCISDVWRQVGQIQPEHETASFFGRLTKTLGSDFEAFLELGLYSTKSSVAGLPLNPSGGFFTPAGVVVSQTAVTQLGAAHPDNPYPGAPRRLMYNPVFDLGPGITDSKAHTVRVVTGVNGKLANWDIDAGLSFSQAKQTDTARNRIDWRVKNALLNPTPENIAAAAAFNPAYAALPAGTVWRIGENAHLNSRAMYDALLEDQQRKGYSRQYGLDVKASREIGQLAGGAIGLAVGGEARHEENELPLYPGLGNYIGLSLTGYGGKRDIYAAYTEVLLPVTKQLEVNGAVRFDHYSDAGNAWTPKVGLKFKALESLALRATLARGFRAPSSTENSASSVAAFGGATVNDEVRYAALIAGGATPAEAAALARGIAPTFVQRGNPDLDVEKSTSTTLGLVWEPTNQMSVTADLWQIKRKGLPVIEDPQSAVDAGRITRDPSTSTRAGDPGGILSGFVVFQNSAESLTRGFDVEVRQRFNLGATGRLTAVATWTHLLKQRVTEASGTVHEYAGTHGDCHITNCMGSPRDRISLSATWETGPWRFGTNVNYRGSMTNQEEEGFPCAQTTASGAPFPGGCKVRSFTTMDISAGWKIGRNTEIFGSIQNLFDAKPPADFLTYGAIGYNPLDYSGAIGRFYRVGLKHSF